MLDHDAAHGFSGAAKIWSDLAATHPEFADGGSTQFEGVSDEYRDEYVRIPYDETPVMQACSW